MTDPAQGRKPRYEVIADELRARINAGAYSKTGKLPSERELSEEYETARNTVRDAIQVLRAEDLVESRGGSGVYLRSFQRIKRDAVERLSRKHWGAGRAVWDKDLGSRDRSEEVTVKKVTPPAEIAGTLGIKGKKALMRSRVFQSEGRKIQRATSWYPVDLVDGTAITQQDTGPGGSYARLDEIGHGPARYREEIKIRLPLSAEAKVLGVTMSTPVVFIMRTAFDSEGRPVEVNEMMLDSDSYTLIYTFPS